MTFVNFKRVLRPDTLYKFHFHESTIFSTVPQTRIINNVILNNKKTQLIKKNEEEALQKSFESIINGQQISLNSNSFGAKSLNKLYSRIYYPFLSKSDLTHNFKDNDKNLNRLKKFVLKHIRLNNDAQYVLEHIYRRPMFDFGIVRDNYYPSLGITDDYKYLLKNANIRIFKNHLRPEYNYSSPLSSDFKSNEEILISYLKKSSQLHNGTSNLKNFLVINNPNQSEFFISLAMKLNINIIVLTQSNFILPSSTINHEVLKYNQFKNGRNLSKCQEIHTKLLNMKLISMKSMMEFMQFLDIIQDPYLRLYQMDNEPDSNRLNSFDKRLLEMELSILGDVETKSYRFRA